MPNHLHGIVVIGANTVETTHRVVSTGKTKKHTLQHNSLGSILGQFKSKCTKRIHAAGHPRFSWQPRFYDHIIRDDRQLERIREYIEENPVRWYYDKGDPEDLEQLFL